MDKTKYYVLKKKAVPEVLLKVVEEMCIRDSIWSVLNARLILLQEGFR